MTHWAGPGVVLSYSQDYGLCHDKSSEVKREIQSAIAESANGRHKHQQTNFEHIPTPSPAPGLALSSMALYTRHHG